MSGHLEVIMPSPAPPGAAPAAAAADCFPVRIGHVPGRGRGFFAARDIAQGETVFRAAPLAWAVSEDWTKHTCWWCFAHDSRHALPLKAAASSGPARGAQYRGVFCSAACAQSALRAHGGQERWDSLLCLLNAIEAKVAKHKAGVARPLTSRVRSRKAAAAASPASPLDPCVATFVAAAGSAPPALAPFAAADFDPCEASDAQLAEWISLVWDAIAAGQDFAAEMPDTSQRELVRLIATELFVHDAAPAHSSTASGAADSSDWIQCVVSQAAADGDIAPPLTLQHMRSSEIDHVRARLCELQFTAAPGEAEPLSPGTLVPLLAPQQPLAGQVEGAWWGGAFRAAAASYALLCSAWQQAAWTHPIGALLHERFRAVYFREIANAFGVYDPPATIHSLRQEGPNSRAVYQDLEQEDLGTCIYPTAVYFNHACCPNVAKTRVGRNMWFVSAAPISQGEEMFIAYGNIAAPVAERRARLREHFFFDCSCRRCISESVVPDTTKPRLETGVEQLPSISSTSS